MAETAQQVAEQKISDKLFGEEEPEKTEVEVETEVEPEVEAETEESVEETEETEDEAEKLFEIEVEGQLYEVPEPLKDAFVFQKDYTQKTQEVATERKELEVQSDSVKVLQENYLFLDTVKDEVDQASILKWQIDNYTDHLRKNMESLTDRDIMTIRSSVDEFKEQRQAIIDGVTLKYQDHQQAAEQVQSELRDKSTEVLRQKVPGWGDEHEEQSKAYGLSVGFTEGQITASVDPREREVLWKAAQFDRLQQNKAAAVKKVETAPTLRSKSRNPMPDGVKRKLTTQKALKSATSDKDKAKIIEEDMARRLGIG